MPEVTRAVVLPDLFFTVSREKILTRLLFWDSLEIATGFDDQPEWQPWLAELDAAGAVSVWNLPKRSSRSDAELLRAYDDRDPSLQHALVPNLFSDVRCVVAHANSRGLPSIPPGIFSASAMAQPPRIQGAAHVECALIEAIAHRIVMPPETPIKDVLSFREKNAPLMGRFRASLTDLAPMMRPSAKRDTLFWEAHAVVRNRIDPAVADLTATVRPGPLRYAWKILSGAGSVAIAPTGAVVVTAGSGQTRNRTFDRQRLVRDHPFGLLYSIQRMFGYHPMNIPWERFRIDGDALGRDLARWAGYTTIESSLASAEAT
jgi:hypothetical protein